MKNIIFAPSNLVRGFLLQRAVEKKYSTASVEVLTWYDQNRGQEENRL